MCGSGKEMRSLHPPNDLAKHIKTMIEWLESHSATWCPPCHPLTLSPGTAALGREDQAPPRDQAPHQRHTSATPRLRRPPLPFARHLSQQAKLQSVTSSRSTTPSARKHSTLHHDPPLHCQPGQKALHCRRSYRLPSCTQATNLLIQLTQVSYAHSTQGLTSGVFLIEVSAINRVSNHHHRKSTDVPAYSDHEHHRRKRSQHHRIYPRIRILLVSLIV